MEILDGLVERSASALPLSPGTRDSSREAVRTFLASLSEYRGILEKAEQNLEDVDAIRIRAALTLGGQVHARLQEQALQLTLISKVVESETGGVSDAPSPDPESRVPPSLEYLQVIQRTAALAASIDNYLSTLHQKSLIPYADVPHPAVGVFHFLRLHALRDPHLQTHSRYFDGAWKAWIQERREQGQFEKCLSIFHLVTETAGEFHPDSLQPLSETLHASVEKPPELHEVEKMETALDAVKEATRALRRAPTHWESELQRITATLMLVRAYVTEDPGKGLSLALEARKLNPLLEERVVAFVVATAETVGNLYIASEQYDGSIVAFRRTLDLGAIPDRDRLVSRFRSLAFERGLEDAQKSTNDRRFGSARAILEQLGRIAEDATEKAKARSALHGFYRAHVSRTLEQDPDAAVEIAQEMIRAFPSDGVAKRKMDDVLFRLLRKSIGDLETSHRRLGSSGILERLRSTVAKMATTEGTEACQRLLDEIEDAWTRDLRRAGSASQVFSIASDIARLKGETPEGARRSGARALSDYFEQVGATKDWEQVEASINRHLSSCPSEPLPRGYREVYLELLAHLDRGGPAARLGRHLAIFCTTFPGELGQVRDLIVKRMAEGTSESVSFYALLRTVAPESKELEDFEGKGLTEGADLEEALGMLISRNDLEAARLQRERALLAAAAPRPRDAGPVASGSAGSSVVEARPIEASPQRANRGPEQGAVDRATRESDAIAVQAALIGAAGCALLLVLLAVVTRIRGLLAFRWYALAALWLGVTIGFVLGTPSIAARLTNRVDTPPGGIDSRDPSTVGAEAAALRAPRRT